MRGSYYWLGPVCSFSGDIILVFVGVFRRAEMGTSARLHEHMALFRFIEYISKTAVAAPVQPSSVGRSFAVGK